MRTASAMLAGVALLLAPVRALTQPTQPTTGEQANPAPGQAGAPAVPVGAAPGEPGFTATLFDPGRTNLLGDIYGLRTTLGRYGISLGLQETSEVFGNVTGGVHRGAAYDGLTTLSLGVDTEHAFGWAGGVFNVSAFQIHGRDLSTDNLRNLNTNSGIQALRSTRLWELWYQQTLFGGRADVKIGQQSVDQEFLISQYAGTFINTALGWPIVPSFDLYAGGPAYPLSSLGVRVRVRPTEALTVLAAVLDDNPPGGPFNDDSQVRGAAQSGTKFNLRTGALFMAELQYAVNPPAPAPAAGASDAPAAAPGLAGTYKLGGWYDTGPFPDQRLDAAGRSLADPAGSGTARRRGGNWSLYGVADQAVWQPDPAQPRTLGVFARIMGAPGDRNQIDFGLNAGVVLKAPLPGRDNDSFGVAYGLARVGSSATLLDRDQIAFSGLRTPVRSSESFIEVTYQYQVAAWWQVQPDAQYVFLPGGGIADPSRPGRRIGNEAILGVRTNVTF